jgi:FkbM family methyltransferase
MIRAMASFLRRQPTLGRLALRLLPDWKRTIQIDPIGPFVISIRRNRSYWLRHPLTHERVVYGALERLVRPGDVVYDVGANIGLFVRFLIQHFNAGHVVAFEPVAYTFQLLSINVGLCPEVAARTTLLRIALADCDCQEKMQVDDISTACSTLDRFTGGAASAARQQYGLPPIAELVSVARLDTLLAREQLPPPNLIKLDIEGAAGVALAGMHRTLQIHHPHLVVETHGTDEARAALRALQAHGYHCFGYVEHDGITSYRELQDSDVRIVRDCCQPHHIVASTRREHVLAEIKPHHCWIN